MTPTEIRAAIAASPSLTALAASGDTQAIADALSAGRTKLTATEAGNGTILEALGLSAGNALLDVIDTVPDFRHVKPLVAQGRLRLDSPLTIGALQQLVPEVLTQAQVDALVNRARVADPVPEFDVRLAIIAADGTLQLGA